MTTQTTIKDEPIEVLSTLRYDPNFAPLEYNLGTGKWVFKVPHNELSLGPKDTGYSFPELEHFSNESSRLETFRHETKVSNICFLGTIIPHEKKREESLPVILAQDIVSNWSTEAKIEPLAVVENRLLFLEQQLARLNYTLKYFQSTKSISKNDILKLIIRELFRVQDFNFQQDPSSDELLALLHNKTAYKIRILVSLKGCVSVEAHELPPLTADLSMAHLSTQQYFEHTVLNGLLDMPHSIWDVFMDTVNTETSSYTTFKTTNRTHYNAARERLKQMAKLYNDQHGTSNRSEIIIFNINDQAMEGSITNFALRRQSVEDPDVVEYITPPLDSGCLCGVMRYYLIKRGFIREGSIDRRDIHPGDTVLLFNGVMGCVRGVVRG